MNLEAQERDHRDKRRAAALSISFNVFQTLLKIGAAILTHSVSVFSEAAHSSIDVLASLMAYVGVYVSAAPPDEEHPYGHGKVESLAGFGESILLFGTVVYICYSAISRLYHKPPLENEHVGIIVMAVSAVGCLVLSRYLLSVAKKTSSIALKSNGQHFTADFVTSIGVLLSLFITHETGLLWVDSAMAILIAFWMAIGAWKLMREAFDHLVDRRLSDQEVQRIEEIIRSHREVLGHHRLRTRQSGNVRLIDMHIVVPTDWSVVQAHNVADELEKEISQKLNPAQVVIHVDPYDAAKASTPLSQRTDLQEPPRDMEH
jgi:cation diffusion facilitator family transporter